MSVISLDFFCFFVCVCVLYYGIFSKSAKLQNAFMLLASYTFYGIANFSMLPFLLGVTIAFFGLGIALGSQKNEKWSWGLLSLGTLGGVAILFYCKYLNFFLTSVRDIFITNDASSHWSGISIFVPLGVSFFTFRLISYVVDIYRMRLEPTRDFIAFANYISYFPCLLSGPIDRPNTFLSQIQARRKINYEMSADGFRQILWGVFKKMVIADNLSVYIDAIWSKGYNFPSGILLLTAGLYAVQMYTDFSGYSDMAIGISKVLGIRVTPNFKYPFFALNIAEYWRSWHISLTSWLTDYVFLPLNVAFRNWKKVGLCAAILINLVAVGMWHGANWTYALFGLYHGLLFIPLILSGAFYRKSKPELNTFGLPKFQSTLKMLITFSLVSFGLILFRAENVSQAIDYIAKAFFLRPTFSNEVGLFDVLSKVELRIGVVFSFLLIAIEWFQRDREYGLSLEATKISTGKRWLIYYVFIVVIILFGSSGKSGFIYARF